MCYENKYGMYYVWSGMFSFKVYGYDDNTK